MDTVGSSGCCNLGQSVCTSHLLNGQEQGRQSIWLGFGNVLYQGVKKAVDAEGFIGLFKGGFSACAVGVSAALIFGYLGSLIFKPKMKD